MRIKTPLFVLLLTILFGSANLFPVAATDKRRTGGAHRAHATTGRRINRRAQSSPAPGQTTASATAGAATTPEPAHPAVKPKVIEIPDDQLLPMPVSAPTHLSLFNQLGQGTAIIFTPDLAAAANHQFYQALGFLYLEDTGWQNVMDQLIAYNARNSREPITRVILETHGSWGDGLKLQDGKEEYANRSYISLGALQEQLDKAGVKECIISACNSGRLYRPEIYKRLNSATLLPANHGIICASKNYHPGANSVKILRRRESRFEALTPLYVSELPKLLRHHMEAKDNEQQLVVSDLFLEYVLNDPNLNLIEGNFVRQVSIRDYSVDHSEVLIKRFFEMLDQIAGNEEHHEQLATGGENSEPANKH